MAITRAKLAILAIIVHASASLGGALSVILAAFAGGDAFHAWRQGFRDLGRGLSEPSTRYYAICLLVSVLAVPITLGVTNAWLLTQKRRHGWLVVLAVSIATAMASLGFYLAAAFLPWPEPARLGAYADIAVRWVAPLTLAAWLALVPLSALAAHVILSILLRVIRTELRDSTS